jgi:hypothetical protein
VLQSYCVPTLIALLILNPPFLLPLILPATMTAPMLPQMS